jgi:hypothetical protein
MGSVAPQNSIGQQSKTCGKHLLYIGYFNILWPHSIQIIFRICRIGFYLTIMSIIIEEEKKHMSENA